MSYISSCKQQIMSKLENVLKQLPEPYASQAIANTDKDILKYADHLDTPIKAIIGAFSWDQSPEGHFYWMNLHTELFEKEFK